MTRVDHRYSTLPRHPLSEINNKQISLAKNEHEMVADDCGGSRIMIMIIVIIINCNDRSNVSVSIRIGIHDYCILFYRTTILFDVINTHRAKSELFCPLIQFYPTPLTVANKPLNSTDRFNRISIAYFITSLRVGSFEFCLISSTLFDTGV